MPVLTHGDRVTFLSPRAEDLFLMCVSRARDFSRHLFMAGSIKRPPGAELPKTKRTIESGALKIGGINGHPPANQRQSPWVGGPGRSPRRIFPLRPVTGPFFLGGAPQRLLGAEFPKTKRAIGSGAPKIGRIDVHRPPIPCPEPRVGGPKYPTRPTIAAKPMHLGGAPYLPTGVELPKKDRTIESGAPKIGGVGGHQPPSQRPSPHAGLSPHVPRAQPSLPARSEAIFMKNGHNLVGVGPFRATEVSEKRFSGAPDCVDTVSGPNGTVFAMNGHPAKNLAPKKGTNGPNFKK